MRIFQNMDTSRIWGTLDPFVEGCCEGEPEGRLVGRNVANLGFLSHLLRKDPFSAYHFFLGSSDQCDGLLAFCRNQFPEMLDAQRIRIFPRGMLASALRQGGYHCFHLSDCINYPAHLARLRNLLSPEIFPVTGVTHSLSYARFAKDFLAHLWQGRTARDAIVATSRSAQSVMTEYFKHLLQSYALDPVKFPFPDVAVIPLGVDTQAYVPLEQARKERCRQRLGVAPGRTVLLVLARLSHMSKLDVLPVLRAMQRMLRSGENASDYCLVLAGALENNAENLATLRTYEDLAGNLGLELRIVKNPSDTEKKDLLAAADIFLSPADNLQETFGLTLLEAGASGLPVVASDFDGYRDLVEHGRTGFLIPTLGPGRSAFFNAQSGVLYDNQQHLLMAQQLVVDVPALARALATLRHDPQLRLRMGQAARKRVCDLFSWQRTIESYCELWNALWLQPADASALRDIAHPLDPDYTRIFAAYPSQQFSETLRVRWSAAGQALYRRQEEPVYYGELKHLFDAETIRVLLFLARKECAAGALAARLAELKGMLQEQAEAVVLWALKQDLLERSRDPETGSP